MNISKLKHKKGKGKNGYTFAQIEFDTYRCGMELHITDCYDDVKHLDLNYDEDGGFANFDGSVCKEFEEGRAQMILKPWIDSSGLVHECLHMLNAIFIKIGYKPYPTNDEIQTHMMGHLTMLIDHCIAKHRKKFKKHSTSLPKVKK